MILFEIEREKRKEKKMKKEKVNEWKEIEIRRKNKKIINKVRKSRKEVGNKTKKNRRNFLKDSQD